MKNHRVALAAIAAAYRNGNHSAFGPSSAHMWAVCAGSLVPNLKARDTPNVYSAYGTIAHLLSEMWLRERKKPRRMLGLKMIEQGFEITVDHEMMDYVQSSVDRCILLPGHQVVEQHLKFPDGFLPIPNQGGTMDFAAMQMGHGRVIDHKYGVADQIFALNNFQGLLYALLLFFEWDWMYSFQTFDIVIHQPRLNHYDEWTISRDDLMQFAGFIRERARLAWRINAPRTPDPHACRYCKVRTTCTANLAMQFMLSMGELDRAFDELTIDDMGAFRRSISESSDHFNPPLAHIPTLTTEDLAKIIPYRPMVSSWWEAAEVDLTRRAQAGAETPGRKLVEGVKHKQFKDREKAVIFLAQHGVPEEVMMEKKMKSPAEAVRQLVRLGRTKKEAELMLGPFVERPPGEPELVPLTDRRSELVIVPDSAWGATSTDENEEI